MPKQFSNMKAAIQAAKNARVFLLPPHDERHDREGAREIASEHLRAAVEQAVRAGLDDLAMSTAELARQMEVARV